jgi:hypothetical protein
LLARPLHSEHSLQNTEHFRQRVIGQNTQALNQPISINGPELIKNYVPLFIFKVAAYAKRYGCPPVASGATRNVRRWAFNSSGETTTHGLVFLSQYPRSCLDLNVISKPRKLKQWLREPDAAGVAYFDKFCPDHRTLKHA